MYSEVEVVIENMSVDWFLGSISEEVEEYSALDSLF